MSNGHNTNIQIDTSIIGDAWEILKQRAWVFVGYSVITLVIGLVLGQLWELVLPSDTGPTPESMDEIISQMIPLMLTGMVTSKINMIIFSPFMAGLIIFCIKQIRTKDAKFSDIFEGFNFFFSAFAVVFLTSIASTLGMFACFIGTIFTTALCMFALPLVVDRNLGPWEAITTSWRTIGSQWGMAGLYYFLSVLIAISGVFMCCVGIFWTAPFVSIAAAVLYTKFFDAPTVQQTGYSPYVRDVQMGSMPPSSSSEPVQPTDDPLKPPHD